MEKQKEIIIIFCFILIIFFAGFLPRYESSNLSSLSFQEKNLYLNENSTPYLQESDSYYNYRLTSNFLHKGYMGDEIINGIIWDSHSYYPPGVPLDYPPLIAWLTVSIYYFVNSFTSISLMNVCIWLPAILSSLSGVVGFLFVRRFAGNLGGFFTGMLLVTSNFYYLKTVPGFFDTDMFIIILPLLIIWSLVEANNSKIYKNKIIMAFLSSLLMTIFSLAWNGWQYLFYCILLAFLVYYLMAKKKNWDLKHFSIIVGIFIITSLILMALTYSLNLYKLFLGPLEYLNVLNPTTNIWYPWPDTYKTVLELQDVSLERYIYLIGPLTVVLGICGIVIEILNKKIKFIKENNIDWFLFIFLLIWTTTSVLSLFKGVRFVILVLPPLAVFSGIFIGRVYEKFRSINISLNENKKFILAFLFVIIILTPQLADGYRTNQNIKPFFNDYYEDSATWIDTNTPNNTVIITDWSYGHFYSAVANRSVSFDGRIAYIETLPIQNIQYSSLNMSTEVPTTARSYWIGLALKTDNYTLSRGIFSMLATSGDEAYLVLDKYTNNTNKTIEILKNILGIDRGSAKYLLMNKYNFSEIESNNVLKFTHPIVKRPYVIVIVNDKLGKVKDLNNGFKILYQNKIIKIYGVDN